MPGEKLKRQGLLFAAVAAVVLLIPAGTASAAGNDDKTATPEDQPSSASELDLTNLKLVEGLSEEEKCFFDLGIYPAGGVGWDGARAPVEIYGEAGAAYHTIRGEIARSESRSAFDVIPRVSEGSVVGLRVVVNDKDWRLDQAIQKSEAVHWALELLERNGASVEVEVAPSAPSLAETCAMRADLERSTDSAGEPLNHYSSLNYETLTFEVSADEADRATLDDFAKSHQSGLTVSTSPGELRHFNRNYDNSPFNGGNRITPYTLDGLNGGLCSTAFRLSHTHLISADHCIVRDTGQTHLSLFRTPSPLYKAVGTWQTNLRSADVDVMTLVGSQYSGRIYTGPTGSNSTIAASGVYPTYTLTSGSSLISSGGRSGQGTITYVGTANEIPGSPGCATLGRYKDCQLLQFVAPPGICTHGDSGGPVGVYDEPNGRVISAGIISGGKGDANFIASQHHICWVTTMMAPQYLYGYPYIG